MRKKILLVCDYFLPGFKAGGPITSITRLVSLMSKYSDLVVLCRDRDFGDKEPYSGIERDSLIQAGNYYIVYLSSPLHLMTWITKLRPSVVYINSIFSTFSNIVLLVRWLFLRGCPIILSPRGELGSGALEIKPIKKNIFLFFYKLLKLTSKVHYHATSEGEVADIFRVLNVGSTLIPNLPNLTGRSAPLLEKKIGKARMVYLSRITRKKNLHIALLALREVKGNIIFDIWGFLEDLGYWDECCNIIQTLPKNIEVSYKGIAVSSEVPKILERYHAFLLLTSNENYGHAIVESLDHGLITIVSDQTPWRNLDNAGVGWDLSLSDFASIVRVVNIVVSLDYKGYINMSQNAVEYIKNKFNLDKLNKSYLNLFNSAC